MRQIIYFLLLTFSAYSSANVMWSTDNNSFPYSSATAACTAGAPSHDTDFKFTSLDSVDVVGDHQDKCTITQTFTQYGYTQQTTFFVYSDYGTCDSGSTKDSTNSCAQPTNKCTAVANTSTSWYWKSASGTPESSVSVNGCEAKISGVSICRNTTKGYYVCSGTATLTGNPLPATDLADSGSCTGDACHSGEPQAETKNQDCVYATSNGKATCTADSSTSNPGTTSCGTVNGSWTCIENPKSTSVDNLLNSTKTMTSNADGTVTTVKDDTLTTTSCSGVNSCSTTTTTSSGTTVVNSAGATVSNSSSCSGSKCTSSGTTSTPAAATADEGDDSSAPTTAKLTAPTKGSLDGEGDKWDAKIETAKSDLKAAAEKIKGEFSDVGGLKLSAGAKLYCPPPVNVLDHDISFCLDGYANSLSWIGDAFLLVCAIIALFIIFS